MQPPPMPPDLWHELTEGYREDILKLQMLIGRDLSHWLTNDRSGPHEESRAATVLASITE
jgi:hypothetical protein